MDQLPGRVAMESRQDKMGVGAESAELPAEQEYHGELRVC